MAGLDASATHCPVSARPCHPAEVMCFDDERELLLRWRDLLVESDPDIIIGYNILNFDLPYLLDRAKALGILPAFSTWGRTRARWVGWPVGATESWGCCWNWRWASGRWAVDDSTGRGM